MGKILAAAAELFRRSPYPAVTIERIASHAGVQPATVYNRFGTKAMIVAHLLHEPIQRLLEAAEADVRAGLAAHEAVSRHLERLADSARHNAVLYGALIAAAIDMWGATRAMAEFRRVAYLPGGLELILAAAKERGELADSIDPPGAALMLSNAFCMRMVAGAAADETVRQLAPLLLFGVVRRQP